MTDLRVDAPLLVDNLADVDERMAVLQSDGVHGVFTFEGPHNPFLPLVLAARSPLDIATGVAIAFARTPMTVANQAFDLQQLSRGRFTLGLATQIRPHIEARYSMPWGKPVARIKEFVAAYHAIFDAFLEAKRLDFRGDYYTHTLLPPMFNPGPYPWPRPPVFLGGVGPAMLGAVGEVADGVLVHPFHTHAYLQTVLMPALEAGWARVQRTRDDFAIHVQLLVATGDNEAQLRAAIAAIRSQVAFYASTPAYRHVLAAEGAEVLQPELRTLTKQGRWAEMAKLIDDDLLRRIAVVGEPDQVADQILERYGPFAQRIAIATPMPLPGTSQRRLVARLRQLQR